MVTTHGSLLLTMWVKDRWIEVARRRLWGKLITSERGIRDPELMALHTPKTLIGYAIWLTTQDAARILIHQAAR